MWQIPSVTQIWCYISSNEVRLRYRKSKEVITNNVILHGQYYGRNNGHLNQVVM